MNKSVLSGSEFYEQFSEFYDQMMAWSARINQEGMFFKKIVSDYKLKSSLDVACGTGFHVIMFRRLGLDAIGVDGSPKMIDKAKANSMACGVTVDFVLGDFHNLSKRFSEGFDIITFLGDTLAHIKDKAETKKVIQSFYNILNPGGVLVLQTRNYEMIVKNQLRFMSPIVYRSVADESFFFQLLDFKNKGFDYSIVKFNKHENHWSNSVLTTEIYPCFKNDLEGTLKSVGFKEIAAYQNFSFDEFDKNGAELIFVAKKKGVTKAASKARMIEKKPLKAALPKAVPPPKKNEVKVKKGSDQQKKEVKKGTPVKKDNKKKK
jgi:SAM-dependent methyltransferase